MNNDNQININDYAIEKLEELLRQLVCGEINLINFQHEIRSQQFNLHTMLYQNTIPIEKFIFEVINIK